MIEVMDTEHLDRVLHAIDELLVIRQLCGHGKLDDRTAENVLQFRSRLERTLNVPPRVRLRCLGSCGLPGRRFEQSDVAVNRY